LQLAQVVIGSVAGAKSSSPVEDGSGSSVCIGYPQEFAVADFNFTVVLMKQVDVFLMGLFAGVRAKLRIGRVRVQLITAASASIRMS